MAQIRTLFLISLVSLSVLVTVITAFRVNFPKTPQDKVKQNLEKCDDCDGARDSLQPKLQHAKVESHRSYEEMKKAVREKQKLASPKKADTKPSFKLKDDDDDDDDEPAFSKSKHSFLKDSREIKSSFEIRSIKVDKVSKKPLLSAEICDDDDDDDDDDEEDDDEKSSKIIDKKNKSDSKMSSREAKIENKPFRKIKSDDDTDDDDNEDDDDDDDDDDDEHSILIPSKLSTKHKEKAGDDRARKLKVQQSSKEVKDKEKIKRKTSNKDNKPDDDDDDDDDDDEGDEDEDDGNKDGADKRHEKIFPSKPKDMSKVIKMTKPTEPQTMHKEEKTETLDQKSAKKEVSEHGSQKVQPDAKKIDHPKRIDTAKKDADKLQKSKLKPETKKESKDQDHDHDKKKSLSPDKQEKVYKKGEDDKEPQKKEADHKPKSEPIKHKDPEKPDQKHKIEQEKHKQLEKSDHKSKTEQSKPKEHEKVDHPPKTEQVKHKEHETQLHKPKLEATKHKEPEKEFIKVKPTQEKIDDIKAKPIHPKSEEKKLHAEQKKKQESMSKESKDSHEKKIDSRERMDHDKDHLKKSDHKKSDSSKEYLFESQESFVRSEGYMKSVTDSLHRRNLLQSEFEDYYAFFPTFAPNFSRIHNPECRRHGQILLRQLRGTKLWALNMLDATAKIPSGLLQGNGIQLGDFDQCLGSRARVQLDTGSVVKVSGKYCLVLLDVKAEHPELEVPVHLAQARNLIKSRIDDPGHFVPRFSTLSWGVCVPSACEPEDVEVVLRDAIKHYQHTSGVVIRVKVDPDDCHTEEGDWWDNWMELPTLLTISFYGLIVLLVLVATILDFFARRQSEEGSSEENADDKAECDQKESDEKEVEAKAEEEPKKSTGGGILSPFSLYHTLDKLLGPGAEDIPCINGVRAIATISLLVAHKFLAVAVMPYTNRLKMTEEASMPWWSWARAGWMYTDCFLLLSGTLLAHKITADSDTGAPRRVFSRYLRLTPALLAVVLFYAYVWDLISWGPRWGSLVTKNAELCQESWWWNVLYVQNYFNFEEMCAPQTHQLALDLQLTILGCMIVWGAQVKPVVFRVLLPLVHVAAAYSRYSNVLEHRLTMLAYHGVSVSQLYRTANLSYTSVFHRCTPYLIGLSLGLALQKPAKHNKLVLALGWLFSVTLWGIVWWSGIGAGLTTFRYSVSDAAQYAALAPISASLAVAWVIYVVHNGYCEWLSSLLCSRPLVIISRLSYALYLCQFIIFFTNAATIRTSSEFTLLSIIDVQEISVIFISSVILTLTFITPMQSLHKAFTWSSKSESPEEPEDKEAKETEIEDKNTKSELEKNGGVIIKEMEELEKASRIRQHFVAHREVLEEIPEVEVEFELQRERNEVLEEILEEEEDGEEEEEDDAELEEETVADEEIQLDEELEVIEEEQGGEDDFWADRQEDGVVRRSYSPNDEDDLQEWEWTNNNGNSDKSNGAQYFRYSR